MGVACLIIWDNCLCSFSFQQQVGLRSRRSDMAYNKFDCDKLDEEEDIGTDLQDFKEKCRYVKDFVDSIKTVQCHKLPKEMNSWIHEMKQSIESFVHEQDKGCTPKVSNVDNNKQHKTSKSPVLQEQEGSGEKVSNVNNRQRRFSTSVGKSLQKGEGSKARASSKVRESRRDGENGVYASEDKVRSYGKGKTKEKARSDRRRDRKYVASSSDQTSSCSSDVSDDSTGESSDNKRAHRSRRSKSSRRHRGRGVNYEGYESDSSQSTSRHRGLDYRQAPKMEKFKEESGGDIKQFFRKFEDYCRKNIRGGRNFWINALDEHLEGSIKETFSQLIDQDDEYEDAKEKLIKWYRDSAEVRKKSHKKKFGKARPKAGESLYLFSIKLASLYKKAYPRHDINRSKKLIQQFKKIIPRKTRELLENQSMTRKMQGRKADWNFIQKCIKLKDNDIDSIDTDSNEESSPEKVREVEINLGDRSRQQSVNNENRKWSDKNTNIPKIGSFGNQRGVTEDGCFTCGMKGHYARECRRWNLGECFVCGREDHFARDCPDKRNVHSNNREEALARGDSNGVRGFGRGNQNYRGRMQGHNSFSMNPTKSYDNERSHEMFTSYRGRGGWRGRGSFRGGYASNNRVSQGQYNQDPHQDNEKRNETYRMNQYATYPNNPETNRMTEQSWAYASEYHPGNYQEVSSSATWANNSNEPTRSSKQAPASSIRNSGQSLN